MTLAIISSENELALSVTLELTAAGGHIGFLYGDFLKPQYWIGKRFSEFLGQYRS